MHAIRLERDIDAGIQFKANFDRIEENVDIRTGFVSQIDIQTAELGSGYAWRFNQGKIKRVSLDLGGKLHHDTHGNHTGNSIEFSYWMEFLAQFHIHGSFSAGQSKYQLFNEDDNLVWSNDFIKTYGGDFFDFRWMRGGFFKGASVEMGWEKKGIYNEDFTAVEPGKEIKTEFEVTLRPLSYFEWSFLGNYIRQTIDSTQETVFDGMTYATGLHFQVTRSLFFSSWLKGETRDNQYNFDFLVGYYFGAGNIIQLSYKKSARTEDMLREGGYSLTLKVSYLLRL